MLGMPSKATRRRRPAAIVDIPLMEHHKCRPTAQHEAHEDDRLSRDVVLCDDDDEDDDNERDDNEGTGSLSWVPYIHFGV